MTAYRRSNSARVSRSPFSNGRMTSGTTGGGGGAGARRLMRSVPPRGVHRDRTRRGGGMSSAGARGQAGGAAKASRVFLKEKTRDALAAPPACRSSDAAGLVDGAEHVVGHRPVA